MTLEIVDEILNFNLYTLILIYRNPNTDRLSSQQPPASVSELLFGAGGGSRAELQQRMYGSILGMALFISS